MKKMKVLFGMIALLAAASSVNAAEITTADGVLSVTEAGDEWKEKTDPDSWFVISDGKNTITIDHLSNGETLPSVDVAGDEYGAVCQAFVSTKNEVFVVKGLAASQEDLDDVMKVIASIKVLKYDTKTAVPKEAASAETAGFAVRQINSVYYVTTDELNVRSGYSTNDAVIGAIYYGEPVTVTGAVTKDGADYGWYQIQYNGATGFVSSGFLAETAPAAKTAGQEQSVQEQSVQGQTEKGQAETNGMEQCQYCGQWFVLGDEYRDHLLNHSMENLYGGKEQCQYCGEWFVPGDEYREHLLNHANTGQ